MESPAPARHPRSFPGLALLSGAPACWSPPPPQRPIVPCSVLPQARFVERLAGEAVQVEVMVPPGASPATYEPSAGQLAELVKRARRDGVLVFLVQPQFSQRSAQVLARDLREQETLLPRGPRDQPGGLRGVLLPGVGEYMFDSLAS